MQRTKIQTFLRKNHKSLVLTGMMGAGKTAIGRLVAQKLNLEFVDSDMALEEAMGRSTPDIFENFGEAYFRESEGKVIKRLLTIPNCLIATGGGAMAQEKTRKLILEKGLAVWLRVDIDVLWERVSRKATRPLLQTENPYGVLQELLTQREPFYAKAPVIVKGFDEPKQKVAHRIVQALEIFVEKESAWESMTAAPRRGR